jgi:hypothetical protein
MDDVRNENETEAPAPPPLEQGAIRGAFLARAAQGDNSSAGGGTERETGALALRGAFMRHLTEKHSGAVVGDEGGGAGVLRSIYAARTVVVVATPPARPARKAKARPAASRPVRKAKAAPAKKRARAAGKAKRAQPAAKRGPKKRAAPPARRPAARITTRAKKKKKAKGRR